MFRHGNHRYHWPLANAFKQHHYMKFYTLRSATPSKIRSSALPVPVRLFTLISNLPCLRSLMPQINEVNVDKVKGVPDLSVSLFETCPEFLDMAISIGNIACIQNCAICKSAHFCSDLKMDDCSVVMIFVWYISNSSAPTPVSLSVCLLSHFQIFTLLVSRRLWTLLACVFPVFASILMVSQCND